MRHPRLRCRICQSGFVLVHGDRPGALVWQCPLLRFETLFAGRTTQERLAANEAEQFNRRRGAR